MHTSVVNCTRRGFSESPAGNVETVVSKEEVAFHTILTSPT